ncbi:MAG: 50S ribosomal protein L21 [Thermodesulfobacteriota bacterium]
MQQAVIRTGSKQYLVKSGDVVDIEKIDGKPGEAVGFSDVLMVSDGEGEAKIGAPVVGGAEVKGEIVAHKRGSKIIVFKFKRRKGYRRKAGHRQNYTSVRITDIKG